VRIKKLFFSFPLFPTYHNRTDGIYLQKEQLTEADSFYMLTNIFQSRLISLIIRQFKKNSTV